MAEAQGRPSKESLLTENNEPHEKILSKSHRISILCVASVVIVGISIFIFAIHFPHNRKRLRESTSQSTSTSAASSESSSFDFYIMAMSWQPQFCYSNRNYNHVGCTEPNDYWKSHWTIHGLWPQFSDGSYPSSCSSQQLESSDFQYLSEDLNLYWPNVKSSADTSANSYTHSSFWRHEWSKHGTCTGMSPSLYLQTALKLQVATPDIVGQAYGQSLSIADLQSALDYDVVLRCTGGGQYLQEVWACFSKSQEQINCPSSEIEQSSCNRGTISIASFQSNS